MKRFLACFLFLACIFCVPDTRAQQLPQAVQDHLDRARFDITRQQYDEAIGELRSALKVSNNCVDCYFQLLRAYQLVGAHKDALDTARKALEIAPNDPLRSAAHDAMGVEISDLAKTGKARHEDAEREFRTALQLNPDNMTANYNLGVELMRENRDADGIAVLTEYLERAPEDANAKDARLVIDNPRRAREDFAPADFAVVTTNGEYVTLDEVKGKVVLLDFWASWCAPCVEALPTLRGLAKRYGKDQFEIISISVDQNEQAWRAFMTKHQMDWPQALDRQSKLSHMFNVRPIPTYVLIDAEGIMRSYVIGSGISSASQLDDEVKKYLKNAQKLQTAAVSGPTPATSSASAAPAPSAALSAVPAAVPARNSDRPLGVAGVSSAAPSAASAPAPAPVVSAKWQNVAPQEVWKRVAQCVMPSYPASALSAQTTGTVNIGLGISPQGIVANNTRVIAGPAPLTQPAMDAIRQWKFQPNVVQGEATWTRVRALVHFNADGTTSVDLAPGVLPDDFGDPGTPAPVATVVPKPANSLACTGESDIAANSQAVTPASGGGTTGSGPLQAGTGGVGRPVCIYCPQPAFSQAARDAKTGGIVVLRVVINAEGRPTDIQVVSGPGMGLEENAVAAVRTWRFKPVIGPNGAPVAVVTPLSVKFALF